MHKLVQGNLKRRFRDQQMGHQSHDNQQLKENNEIKKVAEKPKEKYEIKKVAEKTQRIL